MMLLATGLGFMTSAMADGYDDAQKAIEAQDYQKAAGIYQNLAESGEARAQDRLALFHAKGLGGVERNLEKAESLWLEAASQQHVPALYSLGVHYLSYSKGTEDTKKAYMWLFIANTRGFAEAPEAMALAGKALTEGEIKAMRKAAFFCIKKQFKSCEVK
jgi:TPR repeat protein